MATVSPRYRNIKLLFRPSVHDLLDSIVPIYHRVIMVQLLSEAQGKTKFCFVTRVTISYTRARKLVVPELTVLYLVLVPVFTNYEQREKKIESPTLRFCAPYTLAHFTNSSPVRTEVNHVRAAAADTTDCAQSTPPQQLSTATTAVSSVSAIPTRSSWRNA